MRPVDLALQLGPGSGQLCGQGSPAMSRNFVNVVCALGILGVAGWLGAACNGGKEVVGGGNGGSTGAAPLGCPGELLKCGTSCVDARVDPANCGACGEACADGEVCSQGGCGLTCLGGTTKCDVAPEGSPDEPPVTLCIDTAVDADHCGGCGAACAVGEVCQAGVCATECVGGTTKCQDANNDDVCVNTQISANYCGDCMIACGVGQVCQGGACVTDCVGGTTKCQDANMNDVCVDTDVDIAFCGDCTKACAADEVCAAGKCALSCVGGTTKCGVACTNTQIDPAHCGGCGKACGAGQACVTGKCKPLAPAFTAPLAVGYNHSCLLASDGTVKCWGMNFFGQLGLGDQQDRGDGPNEMGDLLPAVSLGTGKTAKAITAGLGHTCAILNDDTLKCWGQNNAGQLGLGNQQNRGDGSLEMGEALPAVSLGTGKTAKAVAAGFYFTCAILNDESVKCWGQNNFGQLGQGDTQQRGDQANEMGDALPAVLLGTGKSAKAIAAGAYHACVILNDDTTKCWGSNTGGRLGLGDQLGRGNDPNEMGDNLPAVLLGAGKNAKMVTTGAAHTCVVLNDDTVKCWGQNNLGQLGLGNTQNRGDQPDEMAGSLPVVLLGGGKTAKAVAAGDAHTCAQLNDDTVKCWGYNLYGTLGQGDSVNRGDNPNELADFLNPIALGVGKTIKTLDVGDDFSCAILNDDSIKCWGYNLDGQLGIGDTDNRGDQMNEMGTMLPAVLLAAP
ncbi:MAG: hypothetical protein EXR75_14630 [Myxococcales bacterium]|nr:hypothetical protein [Myxococcales bacterium]